jgi:hypothetical protein
MISEEYLKNLEKTISLIKKKHKELGADSIQTMECPVCKGVLSYHISSHNGHTKGRCKGEDCLQWVE